MWKLSQVVYLNCNYYDSGFSFNLKLNQIKFPLEPAYNLLNSIRVGKAHWAE